MAGNDLVPSNERQEVESSSGIFLVIVFATVLLYEVANFFDSSYMGLKTADRSRVYPLLGLVIFEMFAYLAFTPSRLSRTATSNMLLVLAAWITLVDLTLSVPFWAMATHVTLACWWIVTYSFLPRYFEHHPSSFRFMRGYAAFMYTLFLLATVYSSWSINSRYKLDFAAANVVYFALGLAPLVLLKASTRARVVVFASLIAISVFSFKRGAIVASVVMLLSYEIVDWLVTKKRTSLVAKKRTSLPVRTFLLPVLLVGALEIANKFSRGALGARFSDAELASGSGRADQYALVMATIAKRDVPALCFGSGSGSLVTVLGTEVHNEWLLFLYSYGVVGVLLYLGLILTLVAELRRHLHSGSEHAPVMACTFAFIVVVGLYSQVYFVHSTFFVFAVLGALRAVSTDSPTGVKSRYESRYLREVEAR